MKLSPRIVRCTARQGFYRWLIESVTDKRAWRIEPPVRLSLDLAERFLADPRVQRELVPPQFQPPGLERLGYIACRLFVVDPELDPATMSVDHEQVLQW